MHGSQKLNCDIYIYKEYNILTKFYNSKSSIIYEYEIYMTKPNYKITGRNKIKYNVNMYILKINRTARSRYKCSLKTVRVHMRKTEYVPASKAVFNLVSWWK